MELPLWVLVLGGVSSAPRKAACSTAATFRLLSGGGLMSECLLDILAWRAYGYFQGLIALQGLELEAVCAVQEYRILFEHHRYVQTPNRDVIRSLRRDPCLDLHQITISTTASFPV